MKLKMDPDTNLPKLPDDTWIWRVTRYYQSTEDGGLISSYNSDGSRAHTRDGEVAVLLIKKPENIYGSKSQEEQKAVRIVKANKKAILRGAVSIMTLALKQKAAREKLNAIEKEILGDFPPRNNAIEAIARGRKQIGAGS